MEEKPKYDIIMLLIANTYEGTRNELKGVVDDIKHYKNLCTEHGLKCYVLRNKNKDDLFDQLSKVEKIITNNKVKQLLLVYSGHGYENKENLISGIDTNDMKKVNLTEITNYLKSVEKLYIFFDGCRVQKESPINYEQITNNFVTIVSAVQYSCPSYTREGIGSHFSNSFFKTFDEFLTETKYEKRDYIGVGIFLSIFYHTFLDYLPKDKGIPNIYANRNVRNRDPDLYDRILKITEQYKQEAMVTKINVQAEKNILKRDLKERNSDLLKNMDKLIKVRSEMEKLEKNINDLKQDKTQLESKIKKQETEIRFIEKKLKELE